MKWQGYDSNENSWAPTNRLLNCQELIGQFEHLNKAVKINNAHSGINATSTKAADNRTAPEKQRSNIGKIVSKQVVKGNVS